MCGEVACPTRKDSALRRAKLLHPMGCLCVPAFHYSPAPQRLGPAESCEWHAASIISSTRCAISTRPARSTSALGFIVGARNRHDWGTHNRLVQMPGFFIEI